MTEALLEEILVELKGSITDFEDDLIHYENRQAASPLALLREPVQLFMRRAHSLKGKLRLANKPTSASLVHELESLLERHLKANTLLRRSHIDLLFDGLDAVLDSLTRGQENWARLNTVLNELKQLPSIQVLEPSPREFPFALSRADFERFQNARDSLKRVICIEKSVSSDIQRSSFENLPIFEDLALVCDFFVTHPTFEQLDRTSHESIVTIAGVTRLPKDKIDEAIFDSWDFCQWPDSTEVAESVRAPVANVLQPSDRARPRRLLIVEDDRTSRMLMTELTRKYGPSQTAADGKEAVVTCRQALEAKQPFDVVFLDIMLPTMDGIAVLQSLRKAEESFGVAPNEKAKVIMTTALSDYRHFHSAFASECDSYLVKPITGANLDRQLKRLGIV